jgi:hypothetical protein
VLGGVLADDPFADRCLSDSGHDREIHRVPPAVRIDLTKRGRAGPRDFQQLGPQLRGICSSQSQRCTEGTRFVPSTRTVRVQAVVRQLSDVDDRSRSIR